MIQLSLTVKKVTKKLHCQLEQYGKLLLIKNDRLQAEDGLLY
jgi:hypothetical protein